MELPIHLNMVMDNEIYVPDMFIPSYVALLNHHYGSKKNYFYPVGVSLGQLDCLGMRNILDDATFPFHILLQAREHFVVCVVRKEVISDGRNGFQFNIYDPFYNDLYPTPNKEEPKSLKRLEEYKEVFTAICKDTPYDWKAEMSFKQDPKGCDCIAIACLYAHHIMDVNFEKDVKVKPMLDSKDYRSLMIRKVNEMFNSLG